MLFFGLIILLVGTVGIIVTLSFIVNAILKKNIKNWKWSGISLGTTIVAILSLILLQETILFPPNPKTEQLVLSAYREAPLGGIWLGVYDDQIWQLGLSPVEITSNGTYQLSGDTLTLIASEGTTVIGESDRLSFIIESRNLVEVENTGIRILEIQLNKLPKKEL